MKKTGLLLTNTGTPDAPTTSAVRRYLREFLSDKRIVSLPRLIWLPILYGFVLTLRPKRSAALYKKIWTEQGSPMRTMMDNIAAILNHESNLLVEIGMNYGNPSIQSGINKLIEAGVKDIIVMPLYPQYSFATTASSDDRVALALKKYQAPPPVHLIHDYADEAAYIEALASSIQSFWTQKGKGEHLLISFHGIPERFIRAGDPYASQCSATAKLLAEALQLDAKEWTLCYQSKFGYDKWLTPSTQALFEELPGKGIKNIDIICPGFAVDCLETLEEIKISGEKIFLQAGGEALRYIPALNDTTQQIQMIRHVAQKVNFIK